MFIYVAHPIDFAGEDLPDICTMVDHLTQSLHQAGATAVYRPAAAWSASRPMNKSIQEVNMCALLRADALISILPEQVATIGVPFEMGIAYGANIPTVLIRGTTTEYARKLVRRSAMLAFLDLPIYGYDDVEAAAYRVVTMAIYRRQQEQTEEAGNL
jgi:nucleoside 2-deoxyribosyltransferase